MRPGGLQEREGPAHEALEGEDVREREVRGGHAERALGVRRPVRRDAEQRH